MSFGGTVPIGVARRRLADLRPRDDDHRRDVRRRRRRRRPRLVLRPRRGRCAWAIRLITRATGLNGSSATHGSRSKPSRTCGRDLVVRRAGMISTPDGCRRRHPRGRWPGRPPRDRDRGAPARADGPAPDGRRRWSSVPRPRPHGRRGDPGRAPSRSSAPRASTSTFVVHYDAGFNANPAAKAAFQAAVDQWSNVISSPGSHHDRRELHRPAGRRARKRRAPEPLRELQRRPQPRIPSTRSRSPTRRHGSDLDPAHADIGATFSSTFSGFYFGTDGNTGGKVDFESVVMHELGHGLGFLGSMNVAAASAAAGAADCRSSTTARSRATARRSSPSSRARSPSPERSRARTCASPAPAATAANGGVAPKLYAPAIWQAGSSYSHLDEATYPAGNVNSLMTPAIGANEVDPLARPRHARGLRGQRLDRRRPPDHLDRELAAVRGQQRHPEAPRQRRRSRTRSRGRSRRSSPPATRPRSPASTTWRARARSPSRRARRRPPLRSRWSPTASRKRLRSSRISLSAPKARVLGSVVHLDLHPERRSELGRQHRGSGTASIVEGTTG